MKKLVLAIAFAAILCVSDQLFAQKYINTSESNISGNKASINATRSNIKHNKSEIVDAIQLQCLVSIVSNEIGCDIVFTNQVKSPRDAASGLATSKRMHKPYMTKATDIQWLLSLYPKPESNRHDIAITGF